MFKISEFSKIARIPSTQLRHYDNVGLFQPAHIDPDTGYRYYSASQLPQLNRILVLKDLGLSIEQIKQMVDENITAEEIHGMLMLKRAQIEQTVREEVNRFRSIEERIYQIETEGVLSDDNVVVKSAPQRHFLSIRQVAPTVPDGFSLIYEIHRQLPQQAGTSVFGRFGVLFHSRDFTMQNVDVEMGFLQAQAFPERLPLSGGRELTLRTLPPVDTMATLARRGIFNDSVGHYAAIGTWIENHNYEITGAGWEVFIEPFTPGREDDAVIEIQIPVQKHDIDIF